jgi:hypothetical protein
MRVSVDGTEYDVPGATTLAELLEGIGPTIDPSRLVTELTVDGAHADATDRPALAAWRLTGGEAIRVGTETPEDFARVRRGEIAGHLARIADMLTAVAHGFTTGLTGDANRVLAAAARDLGLVLELDQHLARLGGGASGCDRIAATVERIGSRLTDAERDRRWSEVARLLSDELVPVLRAS